MEGGGAPTPPRIRRESETEGGLTVTSRCVVSTTHNGEQWEDHWRPFLFFFLASPLFLAAKQGPLPALAKNAVMSLFHVGCGCARLLSRRHSNRAEAHGHKA